MIETIFRKNELTPAESLGSTHKNMIERYMKRDLLLELLDSGKCNDVLLLNFTTTIDKNSIEVTLDYEQNKKEK